MNYDDYCWLDVMPPIGAEKNCSVLQNRARRPVVPHTPALGSLLWPVIFHNNLQNLNFFRELFFSRIKYKQDNKIADTRLFNGRNHGK